MHSLTLCMGSLRAFNRRQIIIVWIAFKYLYNRLIHDTT